MNRAKSAALVVVVLLIVSGAALVFGLLGSGPSGKARPVSARRPLSFSGTAAKRFDRPMAVAFGQGKLFVADGLRAVITTLDRDGKFLYSFSSRPETPGLSKGYPTGLALGPGNQLYVADLRNEDVWVFTAKGRFLWSLKRRGARFGRPGALAFAGGKLYVSDLRDQTIKEFTSSGKLSAVFGGAGSAGGRFAYVTGIAVDRRGRILVADSYNRRIQVLSPRGAFMKTLAAPKGFGYALPRALTIDGAGRVYVIDSFRKAGLVFDLSGRYLRNFPAGKDLSGLPNAVAVDDRAHRLFVTDKLLGTVSIWRLSR